MNADAMDSAQSQHRLPSPTKIVDISRSRDEAPRGYWAQDKLEDIRLGFPDAKVVLGSGIDNLANLCEKSVHARGTS